MCSVKNEVSFKHVPQRMLAALYNINSRRVFRPSYPWTVCRLGYFLLSTWRKS